jgi:hypothetical protein
MARYIAAFEESDVIYVVPLIEFFRHAPGSIA